MQGAILVHLYLSFSNLEMSDFELVHRSVSFFGNAYSNNLETGWCRRLALWVLNHNYNLWIENFIVRQNIDKSFDVFSS